MKRFKKIAILLIGFFIPNFSNGQCIVIVESANDYDVSIEITITGIVPSSLTCPDGYNFNIEFDYDITIDGPDAPGSLYTLQGNMACDDFPSNFYNLPNSGGSGSGITVSNPYNSDDDCLTSNPESLGCDAVSVRIHGPGIPDQTVECFFGGSLPISLLSFHATANEKNQIDLSWITLSETNNAFFTIEHSTDGLNWSAIHKQSGAGNSTEQINYNFLHERANVGINYYRLKQTDFDGKLTYSMIRAVDLNSNPTNDTFVIYPNPGINQITIQSSPEELAQITIYDGSGKAIIDLQPTGSEANKRTIDVSDLAAGIYFVKTQNHYEKLIINH